MAVPYSLKDVVAEDLRAAHLMGKDESVRFLGLARKVLWSFLFHPRFFCVFCFRLNRYLHDKKLPGKNLLSARRTYWFGNDISFYADIGPGLRLVHLSDIVIGGNVTIGRNATILNGVTIGAKRRGENDDMPEIGDNVYIGSGAKLIGKIRIGANVTIGALSLCNRDVPDHAVAYGIPPNHVIRTNGDPE